MGVYIKEMEMPKGCATCYLRNECCDFKHNITSGNIVKYIDKRLDCCPLVEVPEPHGRLIDESVLRKMSSNPKGTKIDRVPTVIEAEGE